MSKNDVANFVIGKFRDVKKSNKIGKLIEFHTMNKYLLMSHDQDGLKMLGNLVASHKKIPLTILLEKYSERLKVALDKEPTTKTHFNVMMHIFGYFSKHFAKAEKDLFHELLLQFKDVKIPVGKMLPEIGPLIYRFNNTYLARQNYFLLYADPRPGILFAVFDDKTQV